MEEGVKLITGTSLEGEEHQFFIFVNQSLGKGAFGEVKKAVDVKHPNKHLAVKIIPYGGDKDKKKIIEQEINILRLLPQHENLVRVLPYKCFSQHNFYIFMELCPDGQLADLVEKDGQLQEETILSIFYQLMSGYRVLWEAGIVHQDLKLANVLVKNGVLKITDFGFSILLQKYQNSLIRAGTFSYMPYQKLTDKDYKVDSLSDVYSLGVMMFEVLAKRHPYVSCKGSFTLKQYAMNLRVAKIIKPSLLSYSLHIHKLLDIVVRMCSKASKSRITCQEIYEYLDKDQVFAPFREKKVDPSAQINLPPLQVKIQDTSVSIFVPLQFDPQQEEEYIRQLEKGRNCNIEEQTAKREAVQKVKTWVLGIRVLLYYFDRLARRLTVQKGRQEMVGQILRNYNQAILSCLALERRLVKEILQELKQSTRFAPEEILCFKSSEEGKLCENILRKDDEHTKESLNDHLKRTEQVEAHEQKEILDTSQQSDPSRFFSKAKDNLMSCIKSRCSSVEEKSHLVTLAYLFDAIGLIERYPDLDGLQLEGYFYVTETKGVESLLGRVLANLERTDLELPVFSIKDNEEEQWI